MAEIVGSLFGVTPDMYERQQRQSALNEGIAMARLAPEDRAQAMIYSGAAGLGRAGGGLLGAEDPQMKLISARQSVIGQLDQTDPASLLKGAQILTQMGDQQGAFALADYARKAQESLAQTKQRQAAALASEAQAGRERQQATPNDIQIANRIASLRDGITQLEAAEQTPENIRTKNILTYQLSELERITAKPEQKDKYSAFGQTLIDAGLKPGTEPFQKRMLEYATEKAKGAGKGTGNVTIGGITVDTGVASKEASKIIGQNVANIETQFSLKTAFDDAIKLVNQGIYGGAYGPEKQFLAKFTGIGSPQKVENTEVFMANIGEIVIPRLQQFGGNDSNEELKYLQKVVAGELRMEPKAMLRVLESAERKTRNNIERLQKQTSGKPGEALPTTPMNLPLGSPQNPIKLKDK